MSQQPDFLTDILWILQPQSPLFIQVTQVFRKRELYTGELDNSLLAPSFKLNN